MGAPEPQADILNSLAGIDRVIHEPARLMILIYLEPVQSADFVFLMRVTDLTWGNLSSHLSKLEAAGYVEIEKEFKNKKPRTVIEITPEGREALDKYRSTMNGVLNE